MSNTYLFLLGRLPDLSLRELSAVLGDVPYDMVTPQIASVQLEDDQKAKDIFAALGGSLKLLKQEGEFTDLTSEQLEEYAVAYLAQFERPTFSIAEFNRNSLKKLSLTEIKRGLKERNLSSRFIEGPREGLSAAVLLHHDVQELNIIQLPDRTLFALTLAVQDIDEWTRRDRSKPYADRKKGMLPPKVARMMVNMALGTAKAATQLVYDPFCGTGTVLLEALMRGCKVVGSDLDPNSVMGTQNNLNWFEQEYQKPIQAAVFVSDASAATLKQLPASLDLIVTEPFLGKQTPQTSQLPNIFKGLEKMYVGVFKQWATLLKPNAKVVVVFPMVQDGKKLYSLEGIIDKLATFGYTASFEPVVYQRPEAVVQRQIWQFSYQK